ncbi:glycosyltransferase, partial [bacterium]|nr:glycosyltransferase [bacterium]
MNFTFWTFARDGKLPDSFPREKLAGETLLLAGGNSGDARALHSDPQNFAACMNEAARRTQTGLVVFLPPDLLDLPAGWKERLLDAAFRNEKSVFFYGDCFLRGKGGDVLQTVRFDIGDISEREDWGVVWAVRAEWLNSIGGLDETHHRAAFYDLLLRSWMRRVHVGGALAEIPAPARDSEADTAKNKLFFPGRGKLGGFSYLFMDPEEERHIEEVFYNFLKRENCWLEGERTAIPPIPPASGGEPLVSVVTPVFNRARFIGKAIESVQRQTLMGWEYIIVDNGSTDETRDVVRAYAAKDSRVRLIEYDRNVIAESLNTGVRAACGRYVAQLDSDDEYLPHTLEKMTSALAANPTWGLAISYYELMDENGQSLPEFGVVRHERYNRNNILRRDGAGALRCWHRS